MPDKCDVCGHETIMLDHGTGKYAEKMVCGLCEGGNFREQLLRVEIAELKGKLEGFDEAAQALFDIIVWLHKRNHYAETDPVIANGIAKLQAIDFIKEDCYT